MASKVQTEEISDDNITKLSSFYIYIAQVANASGVGFNLKKFEHWSNVPFVKYQIRETDFRRKTANFTTSYQLDLTDGLYIIKIVSTLHENFTGVFLSKDYTINDDGTFTYQCQDFGRFYQSKTGAILAGDVTWYRYLKWLLSRGQVPVKGTISNSIKKTYGHMYSGLKPLDMYKPSLYGNPIGINMLAQKPQVNTRGSSQMDQILAICHTYANVDVYFNSNGVLQIKPISNEEWKNTGLVLTEYDEVGSADIKFDTKNVITNVHIQAKDETKNSTEYTSKKLLGLDLTAFFGIVSESAKNPASSSSTAKSSSSSSSSSKNKTSSSPTKTGNPYGTKRKYLLIDADGGETVSFLNEIAKHIRKGGWTVDIDKNIGPGAHSRNKGKVKNGCYMNVYNGLCADTIWEMGLSYYGGTIKKNGSVHCPAWDSRTWTNPNGNGPYRNSIEKLKSLKTAHDWKRGSTIGNLKTPAQYMANHGVKYCVAPSAKGIADQFLAGGFRAYKGIK